MKKKKEKWKGEIVRGILWNIYRWEGGINIGSEPHVDRQAGSIEGQLVLFDIGDMIFE
jgi:hypothetical protein